jgi:hypothetical protein
MVKLYGMNGSLVSYGGVMAGMMGPSGGPTREVERLLDQNFKKVKMLLEEHRGALIAVAEALIEKHALIGDEVYELCAKADARTNGHNGHDKVEIPDFEAPAAMIGAGGQQRIDPPN